MKESHIAIHGRLSRIHYKKTKGKSARRRLIKISNALHEVHRPWYQRDDDLKIPFDLT